MIGKGSVVYRLEDDYLTHLNRAVLLQDYPPPGSVCIVIDGPKEKDLAGQLRATFIGQVCLKKAIDVMYNGKVYKCCELRAFDEVKNDRRDLQNNKTTST